MDWFIIKDYAGHVGAGNNLEVEIGLKAKDTVSALESYRHLPGIKKHTRIQKSRKYKPRFQITNFSQPRCIRLATPVESKVLREKYIEAQLLGNSKTFFYLDTFA